MIRTGDVLEEAIILGLPGKERERAWEIERERERDTHGDRERGSEGENEVVSAANRINAHFLLFNGTHSTHIRCTNKGSTLRLPGGRV